MSNERKSQKPKKEVSSKYQNKYYGLMEAFTNHAYPRHPKERILRVL